MRLLNYPLFDSGAPAVAIVRVLSLCVNGIVISVLFGELHASRTRVSQLAEARGRQSEAIASSEARHHTVLEHVPGLGSTFVVRLPLADLPADMVVSCEAQSAPDQSTV